MQLKDFILDTSLLPNALPTGQYRIDVICFDGKNTSYFVGHLFLSVKSVKTVRKKADGKNRRS